MAAALSGRQLVSFPKNQCLFLGQGQLLQVEKSLSKGKFVFYIRCAKAAICRKMYGPGLRGLRFVMFNSSVLVSVELTFIASTQKCRVYAKPPANDKFINLQVP